MRAMVGGALVVVLLLAGCQPSRVGQEQPQGCVPKNLKVEGGNRMMTVTWEPDCERLISGYYIYISEKPLYPQYGDTTLPKSIQPFNHTAFAGDTDPEDGVEHFEAERLDNGKKYYVSVRTVFPDLTLSNSSNEVLAVCGPRGEIELVARYKAENDGYSFAYDNYVRADDLKNDLYFYTSKDSQDYLASPVNLDGFLRKNQLALLPYKGDLETVRAKAVAAGLQATDKKVAVKANDWVLIKTADDKFALVKVLGFTGSGDERRIKLYFAYSTIADELLF